MSKPHGKVDVKVATVRTSAALDADRLSLKKVASPRTARPILNEHAKEAATNRAGSDSPTSLSSTPERNFAFGVPETPPPAKGFRKFFEEEVRTVSVSDFEPFPGVAQDGARHVVCMDSLAPWTYLLQVPGKNTRDSLIEAFNHWLACKPDQLDTIKQVVGYLHSASLIIDDIEDESETRRGAKAAHIVYGIAPALNAGNYVYFLALEKLLTLQSTECVQVFTAEMLNLHRGQGRDIFWRTTSYFASEEEYRQMVCDKTGGLFRLAIRIMQTISVKAEERMKKKSSMSSFEELPVTSKPGHIRKTSSFLFTQSSDFTVLADQLACYFQVRDDLINLASPNFHKKKGFCEDITEGKLSFIALHSLRTYRDSKRHKDMERLLGILKSKTTDKKTIKEALRLMDDTKSFEYTIHYLENLVKEIKLSISLIENNPKLLSLVESLAEDVEDCRDVRNRVINAPN